MFFKELDGIKRFTTVVRNYNGPEARDISMVQVSPCVLERVYAPPQRYLSGWYISTCELLCSSYIPEISSPFRARTAALILRRAKCLKPSLVASKMRLHA